MYVTNTTYALNCYIDGNGLTAKIGPDDWVKLVATGYDTKGAKTGETGIYLCNGPDNIIMDWTKWDLSGLGKVAKVTFNVTGSSDNGYGFSQPAYFAYDDVAVRFEKGRRGRSRHRRDAGQNDAEPDRGRVRHSDRHRGTGERYRQGHRLDFLR